MVHSAKFKLSQLKLDQENYRLGKFSTQRDTLKAMIEDQKGRLVRIAKDLIDVGPSPGEFIWVMPDPKSDGMFIVLEGNRRVTALKILETPELADGTEFEKQFRSLAKDYATKPTRTLEARVFTDRVEAKPWIRRRHMSAGSGVGLQSWKPLAKGRAMRDEGERIPRSLAVVELLDDGTDEWAEIEAALSDRWTTVDRVLNSASFPKLLGITIEKDTAKIHFENGDEAAGKSLLRRILSVMASPDFSFSSIEKKGDREAFVGGFTKWAVKAQEHKGASGRGRTDAKEGKTDGGKQASGKTESPSSAAASAGKSRGAKRDSLARDTLAPKSGPQMLPVTGSRLSALYRECRNIKVLGNENASAFLLRVFLELSSEAFLDAKSVQIPHKLRQKGRVAWDDFGISISTKVECVVNALDPTLRAKEFQQTRLALQTATKSYYSIHTLHGYFHNRKLMPAADDLKKAWEAWETYLYEVHAALNA